MARERLGGSRVGNPVAQEIISPPGGREAGSLPPRAYRCRIGLSASPAGGKDEGGGRYMANSIDMISRSAARQVIYPLRPSFVATFGEAEAERIEVAAAGHKNGIHDNSGSDPFRWALMICLGGRCLEEDRFRKYHGIKTSWGDIDAWLLDHSYELAAHDGDVNFIAAMAGKYNKYMPGGNETNG